MKEDDRSDWYDNHPLMTDILFILLPGVVLGVSWVLTTGNIRFSVIQGFLTSFSILVLLLVLEKRYENSFFRYIGR